MTFEAMRDAANRGAACLTAFLAASPAGMANKLGYERRPLVLFAAERGADELVRVLIDAGADLEQRDKVGETPLMVAAKSGHLSTVQLLLTAKAKLNAQSKSGHTALWLASSGNHSSVVVALLAAGCDRELADTFHGGRRTPLDMAARHGFVDVGRLLIEAGANRSDALAESAYEGHLAFVRLCLRTGKLDEPAITNAFQRACSSTYKVHTERRQVIADLIMAGADIDQQWGPWRTFVLEQRVWDGEEEVVAMLLAAGASTDLKFVDLVVWSRVERTLLAKAYDKSRVACVSLLVAAGARIEESDWEHVDARVDRLPLVQAATDPNAIAAAKKAIERAGLKAIRSRIVEICVALQPLHVPAPQLIEIDRRARVRAICTASALPLFVGHSGVREAPRQRNKV